MGKWWWSDGEVMGKWWGSDEEVMGKEWGRGGDVPETISLQELSQWNVVSSVVAHGDDAESERGT